MQYIGKQIEFGVGVEAVRGTPKTTAEKWARKVSANIMSKAEKAIDDATRGVLADSDGARIVKKWYEGEIAGIVHADTIGYLFYNLFGAVSSSQLSGVVYGHAFTMDETIQHPALDFFLKTGASQEVLDNGMVTALEIIAVQDNYVRFTAGLIASSSAVNSDTPSYDTEYDFIGKDITVKIADTEAGLTGATALSLKTVNIKFDQGAISDFVLGAYNPNDIYNAKMSIEGSFTKNHSDSTFETLFNSDTPKYMSITIEGATVIAGGYKPKIAIILNKVLVTDWSRSGGNDELATEEVSFKAFYNATDSEQASVSLQNITQEYDTPFVSA